MAGAGAQSLVCRNAGYEHPVDSVVEDLLACLDDPRLPLLQWNELYAVAQSRLPSDLSAQLECIVGEALQSLAAAATWVLPYSSRSLRQELASPQNADPAD